MNERQLNILYAIINSYTFSAEPVGSRTISKNYDLGISSATIRNEMSDLEELGYLEKAHTSSGRIPSDKAYRHYVDSLLENPAKAALEEEYQDLVRQLQSESDQLDVMIRNLTRILSAVTHYTAISLSTTTTSSTIRHMELVPIYDQTVLLLIVYESGIVRNKTITLREALSKEDVKTINKVFNEALDGATVSTISEALAKKMVDRLRRYKTLVDDLLPIINQSIDDVMEATLEVEGVANIFDFPEYKDLAKAREFVGLIEAKTDLLQMMMKQSNGPIQVSIGEENAIIELMDCSIVTGTYALDGQMLGKIGIIGPTRMPYDKVIKHIYGITDFLNAIIQSR